ncbi:QSPP protein, partial [Acromyrmex charruanus]
MIASTFPIIPYSIEETIAKETGLNVIIDKHGVKKLAEEVIEFMSDNKYTSCTLIRQFPKLYPSFFDIEAGDWLFLLHTLNFSLWIPNSTKQWTVNNYTGFWALFRLYTKAKLLISDLQTYFPISSKSSIKTSTLLKDYRAVQVLLHFGAIRYTENLQLLLRICAVALKEWDAQRRLTERTEMELGRPGAEVQSSAVECYYGGVGQARMIDCNKFGRINDVAEE